MTSRVCRCDGIVPGIVHPDCPIHAPTRDAEQAVREARSLFNQECLAADTVYDADVQDRLDDLLAAVRQAERARLRGIVEGVERLNLPERDWVARADVLAALGDA